MKKYSKKVLSILLVISIIITFNFPLFANTLNTTMNTNFSSISNKDLVESINNIPQELYDEYPDLKSINNKTIKLLNKGLSPEEIEKSISKRDKERLFEIHKEIDSLSTETSSDLEKNILNYLEKEGYSKDYIYNIETKAKEYKEYYKKHQTYPAEKDSQVGVMSTVTYDPVLLSMGYAVTTTAVAQQLATLGTICATAFPYIALIALLAGCTILVGSIIYDYYDNYSDVNDNIIDWYGSSVKQRVLKSSADTRSFVLYKILYGITYWEAYLVDFAGLGGIAVGAPLTLSQAASRLCINNAYYNVYSLTSSTAIVPASIAGSGGAIYHSAHISDGKILNKPHYHPVNYNGEKMKTHSFFGL